MATMITKVKIHKLFNIFDYNIEFNNSGISILTGPNGYGKTTILKIINAFANQSIVYFLNLMFTEIIFFVDNVEYSLQKNKDTITILKDREKIGSVNYDNIEDALSMISRTNPYRKLDKNTWIDRDTNDMFSLDSLIDKIINDADQELLDELNINIIPKTLDVYLIKEQRLIRKIKKNRLGKYYRREEYSNQFGETIEEYAKELKEYILLTESKYSGKSQDLDGSFPRRLFEQVKKISEEEFNKRFNQIKEIQKSLTKYNISVITESNNATYKEENSKALLIYLEDAEKKLNVFSELIKKLELFTDILNEKRLSFKRIEIDKEDGFKFKTDNDKRTLSLSKLSSGEQQEIVLLYELLFKTNKNTLVLIDEPELSLHVVWQKEFLSDLKKVIKIQNINVIIATHSPQILNENWDLNIDLEKLKNESIS